MDQLHVFFFPLMAQGHMLPTIDMAKLFSSRGVKTTLITTPNYYPMFSKSIERSRNHLGFDISIRTIEFPSSQVGLPGDCQSLDQTSGTEDMIAKFFRACSLMQEPVEKLLEESRPHALVADMFFPWATDVAAKFGIPRLIFHGSSSFATSASENVRSHKPFKNLLSDSDVFVVPNLPHLIKLTRGQIPPLERMEIETHSTKLFDDIRESQRNSYGVVVNSFYELEPDYVDYYKNLSGMRAWHIGPFLLCNKEGEDVSQRGNQSTIDAHECLKWLDSKSPDSVVYICFGSMIQFTVAQLHEIAMGIEKSGQEFTWVVRKCADEEDNTKWFPEGFEERVQKQGLIIKGWAPQVLILEHEAVGAFVTHCGWNSTLEGICAGVTFVTWPLMSEQFYNEKLLTVVLRIGVGVGSKQWSIMPSDVVGSEAIAEAIRGVMVGEAAIDMKDRAKGLKLKAKKAVEEGGSSFSDLTSLLDELRAYHARGEQSPVQTPRIIDPFVKQTLTKSSFFTFSYIEK